ncbi:hypothetical protein HY620_02695 [Candidatus Uhrbacteria bacterium]|nr:hypothetical protein [Candidatus Uhrbacteria bacterium]
MQEQQVTIDELARMIKNGFDEATNFQNYMKEFRVEVNQRFDKMEARLDRIEKFTLVDFQRRIERAELDIR